MNAERAEAVIAWLIDLPDWLVYVAVALAAAVENLIPPIPGDMIVVAGGVIVGAGGGDPRYLFLFVWVANVSSALLVYALGRLYGPAFFAGRLGHFLLAPAQVDALAMAYRRFGFPIIFFSRFLPVFRPIVPAFAGVARLGFWATTPPLVLASAIWYGFLVYLGSVAGANWVSVLEFLGSVGRWLWAAAVLLIALVVWWWWRTRGLLDNLGMPEDR
jgi:membrane protein DedA with SNARE-associated domain